MANIVYPMLIFIFVLGAGMAFMNNVDGHGNGLYGGGPTVMPDSGINTTDPKQSTVLNQGLIDTSKDSGLNYSEMLGLVGSTVFGGLTAIATLAPLLHNLGVPDSLGLWLLSPLGLVIVFWLIEMWLGRAVE